MSYWRLHTSGPLMADTSSNSRQGRIEGGVTRLQPGALAGNNGIVTDGATGYVRSNAAFTPTPAFSESVWFKTTTRPRRLHHGLLQRGDRRGNRQQPGDLDGQRRQGRLRDPDASAWDATRGRASCGAPSPTTTASGTRSSGRSTGRTSRSTSTARSSVPMPGSRPTTRSSRSSSGYTRVGYQDLTSFYTVFGSNFDGRPGAPELLLQRQPGRGGHPLHARSPRPRWRASGHSGAATLFRLIGNRVTRTRCPVIPPGQRNGPPESGGPLARRVTDSHAY